MAFTFSKVMMRDVMASSGATTACSAIKTALHWWVHEIEAILPTKLRDHLSKSRSTIEVRLEQLTTSDYRTLDINIERLLMHNQYDSLSIDIKKRASLYLRVPRKSIILREIELPVGSLDDLQSAASFLVEQVTPFSVDNACHVARVISKDRASRLARVELAVMSRVQFEAIRSAFDGKGICISGLGIDGDTGTPSLNFLPPDGRSSRSMSNWSELWKPVLLFGLALFFVGPCAVGYKTHVDAQKLAYEIKAVDGESASILRYRSEFAARILAADFIPSLSSGPYPIEVVGALTKAIPDDTWIFRMDLVPGVVTLAGFSSNIPRLLERLSERPFTAPELISPVVHDTGSRQSRFEIKVLVREAS